MSINLDNAKLSCRNYNIDIMKLFLSLLVVLIHSEVNIGVFFPFLRIAVPIFFITSSYFFFKKNCISKNYNRGLFKFLKRNMTLYLSWFVILFPITMYIRGFFNEGLMSGIVKLLQAFFFNSTFRASWYLMALNIGICISVLIAKKLSAKAHFLITLPIYLICCLFTNYYGLAENSTSLIMGYNAYVSVFLSLANSFPVSLMWISIGRLFAENETITIKHKGFSILFSAVFLIAEHILVSSFSWQNKNDCYIMLIPLCYFIFNYIIHAKPYSIDNYKGLFRFVLMRSGNISTIIYVTHASVITVFSFVLRTIIKVEFIGFEWFIFFITVVLCLGLCFILFSLERFRCFKWIKYLY